jgi:hypothetical protein
MTIADDLTHDPDATAAEVASGSAGSALDRIKQRRNQVSDTLEVGIPSWGGELRAEFKLLDRDRIDEMIRVVQQRARQMQLSGRGRDRKEMARIGNETDMDFLVDACVGIWADPVDADQEREKLSDGFFDMTFVPQLDPAEVEHLRTHHVVAKDRSLDAGHLHSRRGPSVAGEDYVRALAEAAVFGLPIQRMYRSSDGDELALLEAVRRESANVIDQLLDNLAKKIVREYARAREEGRKKSK